MTSRLHSLLIALVFVLVPAPILAQHLCEIQGLEWVAIGDIGNPDDTTGYGGVAYPYQITRYEITNAQYAAFLNAVASIGDLNGLYDAGMETEPAGDPVWYPSNAGGIHRSGTSAPYTYAAKPGYECRPANYVSIYDAMRFANWLHNGQPTGATQNPTTTEDGAYTFSSGTSVSARKPSATVFVSSENEWYKAAYFDPATTSYWDYPTGSDSATGCADDPASTQNSGNCYYGRIETSVVGSYPRASSPYGTYDQGGNLWEFTDPGVPLTGNAPSLVSRGGAYLHNASYFAASSRQSDIGVGSTQTGFRVARNSSEIARPANYERFYSVPTVSGSALATAIATHDYIYLPTGKYVLTSPLVIDRTSPLFIHCADPQNTSISAPDVVSPSANPPQPMFIVEDATLLNITGCGLDPTGSTNPAVATPNTIAIRTVNTTGIQLELQDCSVSNTQLSFEGPGTYRIQNCAFGPNGRVSSPIVLDDDGADLLIFGGDISNGPYELDDDVAGGEYAHVWQKHGRLRIYTTTVEGTLGTSDFRIETRSLIPASESTPGTPGPHVIANVRSEGASGDLGHTGAASRLLHVPTTSQSVDVVIKNSNGSWNTGPPGRFMNSDWNQAPINSVDHAHDTFTVTGHPFRSGEGPVHISSSQSSPFGLNPSTDYYVCKHNANTITLHLTAPSASCDGTNYPNPVDLKNQNTGGSPKLISAYLRFSSDGLLRDGRGPVRISTQGALPSNLSTTTDYWIKKIDDETIAFTTSPGGSPVPILSVAISQAKHWIGKNCRFVSYNGAGTLWLLGNQLHPLCARHLVEGNAPQATIVSIGNVLGAPEPFDTLTALETISAVDAFYNNYWTWTGVIGDPSDQTVPVVRWIPNGDPPQRLNTFENVPIPPEDLLPPSLPRPRVTMALADMINVETYNANGLDDLDDTTAIQAALDVGCNGPPKKLYFPAGTYKITDTLYLHHHAGGGCHDTFAPGGWIAGAGSAVTKIEKIESESEARESVFVTDGLIQATVQGISFKTRAWGGPNDDPYAFTDRVPNFDIEAFGDGPGPEVDFGASQLDGLYDVVFDGGWAAFATGVIHPSVGQCASMNLFGTMFKNAYIGFDSGHANAIANAAYDTSFLNNGYAMGSLTVLDDDDVQPVPPSAQPSQGTYAAYRSTSRGTTQRDLRIGGGLGSWYFYEWDSDSARFIEIGSSGGFLPYMYERSHLAGAPSIDAFSIGSAGGPFFLYSHLDHGPVKVGQSGFSQSYAVKFVSEITNWIGNGSSEGGTVGGKPAGQLEEREVP